MTKQMDGARSTHDRDEMHRQFSWKTSVGKGLHRDLGINEDCCLLECSAV